MLVQKEPQRLLTDQSEQEMLSQAPSRAEESPISAPAFDLESLLSQIAVQHPESIKASHEAGFTLSKPSLTEAERASAGQAPAAAQSQWDVQDKSSLLHHLSSLEVSICCFTHPRYRLIYIGMRCSMQILLLHSECNTACKCINASKHFGGECLLFLTP